MKAILYPFQGSESSSWTAGGEDGGSERVRFDDHVSFIAPHSYEASHSSQCDKDGSVSGHARWWNTEARCHREPSGEEHAGDFGDMKRVTAVWQELKSCGESTESKAVDECVEVEGDGDDNDNDDEDDADDDNNNDNVDVTVASALTSANTAVATAAIPAITTSTATFTACYHVASKPDTSAEIVNKDKLHGTSKTVSGCSKSTSTTALRNVFFHAQPAENKRLSKLRKPQESVGPFMDGEQQNFAWQTLTLPVIPEPSTDQPHSNPAGDEPVKIEIPIESD
jgi:hypothetical protein